MRPTTLPTEPNRSDQLIKCNKMKTYDVAVDDVSGPADGAASGATSSDDAQSDRVTAQSTQISYHGTRLTNPARHVIIHAASHRCSLFYHIARLSEAVPANQVLRCHVDASLGRPPHH